MFLAHIYLNKSVNDFEWKHCLNGSYLRQNFVSQTPHLLCNKDLETNFFFYHQIYPAIAMH